MLPITNKKRKKKKLGYLQPIPTVGGPVPNWRPWDVNLLQLSGITSSSSRAARKQGLTDILKSRCPAAFCSTYEFAGVLPILKTQQALLWHPQKKRIATRDLLASLWVQA
jgi:hypothetical protein